MVYNEHTEWCSRHRRRQQQSQPILIIVLQSALNLARVCLSVCITFHSADLLYLQWKNAKQVKTEKGTHTKNTKWALSAHKRRSETTNDKSHLTKEKHNKIKIQSVCVREHIYLFDVNCKQTIQFSIGFVSMSSCFSLPRAPFKQKKKIKMNFIGMLQDNIAVNAC